MLLCSDVSKQIRVGFFVKKSVLQTLKVASLSKLSKTRDAFMFAIESSMVFLVEGGQFIVTNCTFSNLFQSVVFVIKFDEWSLS